MDCKLLARSSIWNRVHAIPNHLHRMVWDLSVFNLNLLPIQKELIFLGPAHFSENWAYLCISPMVAGNLFSLMFGRNLDAHDDISKRFSTTPATVLSAPHCLSGLPCYVNTIHFTVAANFLAIALSIWAGYRDRQKIASSQRRRLPPRGEVIWEDEERDSEVLPS